MSQCSKFKEKDNIAESFYNSVPVACGNCRHWSGKKCEDESVIRELYEESPKFKALDRMMRQNRGIQIQA